MRKTLVLCLGLVAALGFSSLASADSLTVTHAAAMGGTTWGMQVYHDNSSRVYVQDDTPTAETSYQAELLFRVGPVSMTHPMNFRQSLLQAIGPNPSPGQGSCSSDPNAKIVTVQLWLYQTGGQGQVSNLQVYGQSNQCGDSAVPRIQVSNDQPYRVCIEYRAGGAGVGYVALAVTDPANPCPASGDSSWSTVTLNNSRTKVDLVRLGTPATNTFGAGETMTMYFDEFASYHSSVWPPVWLWLFGDGFEWGDTSAWGPVSQTCSTVLQPPTAIVATR